MLPFLIACCEANRAIARHLEGGLTPEDRVETAIGAGGDVSTGIDLMAEAIFVEHLRPFGRIESEESGVIGSGEWTIILDPIDGSSNILSGLPYYGTSAAWVNPEGVTVAACICNLAAGEIFVKEKNQTPLYGDLFSETYVPFVPTGEPQIGLFERAYAHADVIARMAELPTGDHTWKFRAPGAVALSLVYALRARFFLYVGAYRSYDFAAGLLFCEGLEVQIHEDYVIVTHDKKTGTILEKTIKE